MSPIGKYYYKLLCLIIAVVCLWTLLNLTQRLNFGDANSQIQLRDSSNLPPECTSEISTFFNAKNRKLFMNVMTKLSDILNKTNPVLTIKVNMEGNENEAAKSDKEEIPEEITQRRHKSSSLKPFKSILTPEQKDILMDLAAKFGYICNKLNVTYIMYGGTLLGSYRHHDLIPWDDDIDVFVNITERDTLFAALSALEPKYIVLSAGPRLKFYSSKSERLSKFPWKWPYMDIHFFKENETHILDSSVEFKRFVYKKSITFPTHTRPLGRLYLNSPFDAYATLKATYQNPKCQTHFYSHKYELNSRFQASVPCEQLKDSVPFVHRSPSPDGVRETLILDQAIIHSLEIKEPSYAVTAPYKLVLLE